MGIFCYYSNNINNEESFSEEIQLNGGIFLIFYVNYDKLFIFGEITMKLSQVLKDGIYVLKEKNITDCNLKARILLSFVLDKPREYLIINDMEEIDYDIFVKYFSLLDRLISGEPLQYITGNQEFMGLNFHVDKNVLIPQPDTEILVQVIKYLEDNLRKRKNRFV